MSKLNFYTVDAEYVGFLQQTEYQQRGFSRVPNVNYGLQQKPKFLCGIVLQVDAIDYYVPVSSYKQQKPDNFLIKASNGEIVGSLRFNYMFPVPRGLVAERSIKTEPDQAYRTLLSQELRYCIDNQDTICRLAARTYKRVCLGKDKGLVANSCDFRFLEQKCQEYILAEEKTEAAQARSQDFQEQTAPEAVRPNHKVSVRDRLAQLRQDTLRGDQLPERNERDPR